MRHFVKLVLVFGLYTNVLPISITQKDNEGIDKAGTLHNDDITIDDNWLNDVLNTNETSKTYNHVIIDQEPKTFPLPSLTNDDEDVVDGSGSGDETLYIKENDKNEVHLNEQKSATHGQSITQHEQVRPLPNASSEIHLVDENQNRIKSTTITIRHDLTPSPTSANVEIVATSVETDDDDEASKELGSGTDEIVSDDEESGDVSSVETDPAGVIKCGSTSCKYGATCLIQNGRQTGCVCEMRCENFKEEPVCGTDGMFYENLCHLQLESCSLQVNISLDKSKKCLQQDSSTKAPLPQCETSYPYWTPWSLWIQSGDKEFRFRYCKRSSKVVVDDDSCKEPQMQVRQCTRRERKPCKFMEGKSSMEYEYTCSGADMSDVTSVDEIFPHLHDEVADCEYSLYDVTVGKFVHRAWTIDDLDVKGDKTVWCGNRDRFIPFFDSSKACIKTLEKFCDESEKCPQRKKEKLKSKGNWKHSCWKMFLLGNKLPAGFPGIRDMYFLCQRFAAENIYRSSSSKRTYFGTIYDTRLRIPLMSFGRILNLSDTTTPVLNYMLEKGLVTTKKHQSMVSTVYNWLNGQDRKGMFYDNGETSLCNLGRFQAIPADYETPEYKIQQLLPFSLTGNDVKEKIATYTLTNAAPIHVSLYAMWNTALSMVRNYAVGKCGIPVLLNPLRRQRNRVSRDHPEMYVVSGVVSLDDIETKLDDGVTIPYLFWFAGCCIKGADTSSFAFYARNKPDSVVISAPVAQLEILLSDLYNTTTDETIKLFPAYDDICGSIKSDVSGQFKL